jgi:uroporphyrinogen-III synthase
MKTSALAGKAVVNTRAVHQAAELDALLLARGASPVPYPCIEIAPPEDTAPLDAGLRALAAGEFDWLALTSENAALAVARRAGALGLRTADFGAVKVAAVGPKTAESARTLLGLDVHLVPEEHVAEALAGQFKAEPGSRIFLPHSDLARDALEAGLRAQGCAVTAVDAYRTVPGSGGADVPVLLAARQIDALVFTSPSTVRYFCDRMSAECGKMADMDDVTLASIGPVTTRALQEADLPAPVQPTTFTLSDLVDVLARHFETNRSEIVS